MERRKKRAGEKKKERGKGVGGHETERAESAERVGIQKGRKQDGSASDSH